MRDINVVQRLLVRAEYDPSNHAVTVRRLTINGSSLLEKIVKHYDGVKNTFNISPKKLILGEEDFLILMEETKTLDVGYPFTFNIEMYNGRAKFYDMEVEVIPWMRGAVVLP